MELAEYEQYLERLIESLERDDRVVGLVGLGSTARESRQPDRWSDHDVWVVVADGHEEVFRDDPSWLPESGEIVLWMRETPHGMTALYADGHLVEAAVFRIDELEVTRANDYRVYLDRERISERMHVIRARTAAPDGEQPSGPEFHAAQFLTKLLVGVSRYARGERLSAHDFVSQGVGHLLALIAAVLPPESGGVLDELNPWRRFETAYPALAARIERALRMPLPDAAVELLELAGAGIAPGLTGYPRDAAAVVGTVLKEIRDAGEWNGAPQSR